MPWNLSQNKLFAALAAVVLVTIIGILGYYITSPYVQYEEGQIYKSGNVAVASVRLENKGYFDAEQVAIEVTFPELITEITSGNSISPYAVVNGGKGFKTAVGSIPRINPSQSLYVYFTVDNTSGVIGDYLPGFVRQVTFKNGIGSADPPRWIRVAWTIFLALLGGASGALITGHYLRYREVSTELRDLKKVIFDGYEKLKKDTAEWEAKWKKEEEELRRRIESQREETNAISLQLKGSHGTSNEQNNQS